MREVLTVQAGPYANWVGAHFWNLQQQANEEENHRGHGHQDDDDDPTPVPAQCRKLHTDTGARRLLLFDVAQELDPFRAPPREQHEPEPDLEKEKAALPWHGAIEVHRTPPISSPRMRGEGGGEAIPRSWAAAWRGAPLDVERNCVVVQEYEEADGNGGAAGGWGPARGGDQLHRLLEACDAPQGMHLLVDLARPALGLGVGAAEEFAEEVGGGALVCYAYRTRVASKEQDVRRVADAALAVKALVEAGALLVPSATDAGARAPSRGANGIVSAYHSSALQATALEAVSGVYREEGEGACHMREWVHGLRHGASSLAAVELGLPFPPAGGGEVTSRQALDQLLCAREHGGSGGGLLSQVVSLAAQHHEGDDPVRRRRVSCLVSLYGLPLPVHAVRSSMDGALKYFPWFQPHLNFASPARLPIHRRPFPLPFMCPGGDEQQQRVVDMGGASCLSVIGCTSAVTPFVQELASTFASRGPMLRQRLHQDRGLLEEDLVEVDAFLVDLLEQGVPQEREV